MTKIQTNCLKKKNYPRNYSKKKAINLNKRH